MIDFAAMFPSLSFGSLLLGFVSGFVTGLMIMAALFLHSGTGREKHVLEDDLKRYRNPKM